MSGYIKIHRSIVEWYGYQSSKRLHLWLHLLIKANHAPGSILFSGEPKILSPGQFKTGRKVLSADTGISESYVEDLLNEFENMGQIQQVKCNTSRIITIVKWKDFQYCNNGADNGTDNGATTERQRSDTNKKVKNDKNVKNEVITHIFLADEEFKKLWEGWMESRNRMRIPNTEKAQELALRKLEKMGMVQAKEALRNSIERGWRGVFEPKVQAGPVEVSMDPVQQENLNKMNEFARSHKNGH